MTTETTTTTTNGSNSAHCCIPGCTRAAQFASPGEERWYCAADWYNGTNPDAIRTATEAGLEVRPLRWRRGRGNNMLRFTDAAEALAYLAATGAGDWWADHRPAAVTYYSHVGARHYTAIEGERPGPRGGKRYLGID